MATILDGKKLADKIKSELKIRAGNLAKKGVTPKLATILIGDDPSSKIYINSKTKACSAIGILAENIYYDENTPEYEITDKIQELNNDKSVHGILVQQPLPDCYDKLKIVTAVSALKDVDGFCPDNLGRLIYNDTSFVPCTPLGIMKLLEEYNIEISGKNAVVLGRSNIVGKPMALLLMNENATVTICHSKTKNLAEYTQNADILVSAVGKPNFVTIDMVKQASVVIDVGINRVEGGITGDVDFRRVQEKVSYITPVPGGIGPLTIAMLLSNTVLAAENQGDSC